MAARVVGFPFARGARRGLPQGGRPRKDAIYRVSYLPAGPQRGENVEAGLRPERVRRDESRLYVADFACGGNVWPRGMTASKRPGYE